MIKLTIHDRKEDIHERKTVGARLPDNGNIVFILFLYVGINWFCPIGRKIDIGGDYGLVAA
jgi:hypothetical protein